MNGFIPKEREDSMHLIITEPAGWSNNDDSLLEDAIHAAKETYSEHCGQEELVDWLKSLKGRVLPQQEWSEEDEKKLLCICAWIKDYPRIADFTDEMYTVANNYVDWLKSLRPQNRWKPSEEQMEALYEETQKSDRIRDDRIVSLYNDLEKLREE